MNNTVLLGRLVRDPELKYLPSGGTAVTKFSIAVDKQLSKDKKQEMENQGKPTADFINIVVWGKTGENAANYLKKGRRVALQGRIQTGSYVQDDGTKRYTFEVVAERVNFIDWGDANGSANNQNSNTSYSSDSGMDQDYNQFEEVDEDDIPF